MTNHSPQRKRLLYLGWAVGIIILGLLSRTTAAKMLPVVLAEYSGDCLWACLVYVSITTVRPAAKPYAIACASVVFAFTIELSQLYEADWADRIRDLPGMRLVLGYRFLWSDLACYSVGIVIAWIFDGLWLRTEKLMSTAAADSDRQS